MVDLLAPQSIKYLKNHILILAEDLYSEQVKYIHGNVGKGTFTFLGGHDPEDYRHFVGDPPTDLDLHRNSRYSSRDL